MFTLVLLTLHFSFLFLFLFFFDSSYLSWIYFYMQRSKDENLQILNLFVLFFLKLESCPFWHSGNVSIFLESHVQLGPGLLHVPWFSHSLSGSSWEQHLGSCHSSRKVCGLTLAVSRAMADSLWVSCYLPQPAANIMDSMLICTHIHTY